MKLFRQHFYSLLPFVKNKTHSNTNAITTRMTAVASMNEFYKSFFFYLPCCRILQATFYLTTAVVVSTACYLGMCGEFLFSFYLLFLMGFSSNFGKIQGLLFLINCWILIFYNPFLFLFFTLATLTIIIKRSRLLFSIWIQIFWFKKYGELVCRK